MVVPRLNLLSHLWRGFIGFNLHPTIATALDLPRASPAPAPKRLRVADVGTGTGIWLLELAQTLGPDVVQLDGFDISAEQFPHPGALPPHVQLRTADATADEPPEDCRGLYDVVHTRLLLAVVDGGDPGPLLRYCRKMLSG